MAASAASVRPLVVTVPTGVVIVALTAVVSGVAEGVIAGDAEGIDAVALDDGAADVGLPDSLGAGAGAHATTLTAAREARARPQHWIDDSEPMITYPNLPEM